MADSPTTKGDYSAVPIQIAPGGTDAISRPTKGTHLVWGGTGPSSPWGHLEALIAKAGGVVSYLQTSPATIEANACMPSDAPGDAPVSGSDQTSSQPAGDSSEQSIQEVAATPHPTAPGLEHVSGPSGTGALFDKGVIVPYQGEPTRIWAHPRAANSGPRPLIIYLHGINPTGDLYPALSELVGKAGKGWVHLGKLAHKLIDDGKVTPLAIAAPTHSASAPWDKFDFEELLNAAETKFKESGVEIDLDQIAVVGHGGGGGYVGRGLNKLAEQGGVIGTHKVKLFGIADTRMTAEAAGLYKDGLSKNDTTAIYALHRYTGGWSTDEYNKSGGSSAFAKALGADTENKTKVVGEEKFETIEDYYDNGDTKPSRVSIKVNAAMAEFTTIWRSIGAYGTTELSSHNNALPRWTWWALPRFFAQTDADKKLLASPAEVIRAPKPVPPPPLPPAITGGGLVVPPAAKPWVNPSGEIEPKVIEDFQFAEATGIYYPVRAPKLAAGRGVYYIGTDDQFYGPKGRGDNRAGHFWADRMKKTRKHVGIDMSINAFDAPIVACEVGKILNFYHFYENAWCLIIQHGKQVMNYGEVCATSLKDNKLKVGDTVAPGQQVGTIKLMKDSAMLHFETYRTGTDHNCNYYPDGTTDKKKLAKTAEAKKFLLNPTRYVLALAKKGL